jgi:tetratricopeptide (TPR) repeat protein
MRRLVRLAALTGVLAVAGLARAEPDKSTAQRLKDLGAQAMSRSDFTLALEYFNSAYRAYPSAKLLYNIGLALDGAGRLPEAIDTYRRFFGEAGADTPAEARQYAQKRAAELERRVGTLLVGRQPADAEVSLDEESAPLVAEQPVRVMPGAHTLHATRAGHEPLNLSVEVRAGEEKRVELVLRAVAPQMVAAKSESAAKSEAAPTDRGRPKKLAGIVIAAVGLAALVCSAALEGAASGSASRLTSDSKAGNYFDSPTWNAGQREDLAGQALLAVGAVAAVTGTVVALIGWRESRRSRVTVKPASSARIGGALLQVHF